MSDTENKNLDKWGAPTSSYDDAMALKKVINKAKEKGENSGKKGS